MNQNHPVEVRSQEASNEPKAVNSIEERGSNPTPRTNFRHNLNLFWRKKLDLRRCERGPKLEHAFTGKARARPLGSRLIPLSPLFSTLRFWL